PPTQSPVAHAWRSCRRSFPLLSMSSSSILLSVSKNGSLDLQVRISVPRTSTSGEPKNRSLPILRWPSVFFGGFFPNDTDRTTEDRRAPPKDRQKRVHILPGLTLKNTPTVTGFRP